MIRALGIALVHFVWQGAVVAGLLASLDLALRRASAQARYLLACAALLLMLALPALSFRAALVGEPPAALPIASATFEPPAVARLATASASPVAAGWRSFDFTARLEGLLPMLVTLWGSGVLLLGARSLGGLTLVRRLGRAGLSAPPAGLDETLARLAQALGVTAAVRVYESALVGVPTVVGWLRPVVLLQASALTGLTAQQLELILAHELAHVRRHDYLVNLLQSAAETLLFYHPAVWWVSNRIRVEREHCCDDLAVGACGSAVRYARALVELEGLCSDAPAFAMAASGGSLVDRVVRLVGRAPEPSRAARGLAALAAVAALALAFGFGSILLDRNTPTVVDALAASRPVAAAEAGPQAAPATPESATPKPEPAASRPQAASPKPRAATPKPDAAAPGPQERAFPLERVLEMARAGIKPEWIDEMDALGYRSLDADQLVALRQQGVGPDYVRELSALGYKGLRADQLIGLRAQGVSAEFVKGLQQQGLGELSTSNLLALRAQGVTPMYVQELKAAGFKDLSVTSLLSLRGQGVSGQYASELKSLGYSLSESQLVALRAQGVNPDYVRELGELGYRGLDAKLLLALRAQGVGPDYVRALRELGYDGLAVGQLMELRAQGVTPEYVRELKDAGFEKLTPEELVELRSQGVSPRLLKSLHARKQP
jgi:beta-lactamase regulating signal transducer with metallopeptidase domain